MSKHESFIKKTSQEFNFDPYVKSALSFCVENSEAQN
jgi:hypothetical protein